MENEKEEHGIVTPGESPAEVSPAIYTEEEMQKMLKALQTVAQQRDQFANVSASQRADIEQFNSALVEIWEVLGLNELFTESGSKPSKAKVAAALLRGVGKIFDESYRHKLKQSGEIISQFIKKYNSAQNQLTDGRETQH